MTGNSDTFRAFLPFTSMTLSKAGKEGKSEMRIAGIASTSSTDRAGEQIPQSALDISELLSHGLVNFDHNQEKIIGYPDRTKTKFTDKGLYIESVLLEGVPLAEEIYNTAVALQNSGSDRRYGYSIEGKVLARDPIDPTIIRKAKVINVAVTPTPMNKECTWEVLKKSFSSEASREVIPESLEKDITIYDTTTVKQAIIKTIGTMKGRTSEMKSEVLKKTVEAIDPEMKFTDSDYVLLVSLITGLHPSEIYEKGGI